MHKVTRQREHVGGSSPSIKNLCHPGMTNSTAVKQSGKSYETTTLFQKLVPSPAHRTLPSDTTS